MIVYTSEVTTNSYDAFVQNEGVVIVDLWATWCGPCRTLSPIVESVAAEYTQEGANVRIGKMDIDANREKIADLGVTSIPTILVYKNGTQVDKHVGMIPKSQLKELIQKHV